MKSIKKYFVHFCFLSFAMLGLTIISGYVASLTDTTAGNTLLSLGKTGGLFGQKSSLWFYLIVLSLFIGWTLGGKVGFVSNVLCYLGGYVLAFINQYLNEPLMALLANLGFKNDSYITIGASLIILVLFLALLALIDKLLKIIVKMLVPLKYADRFLGSVLGLVEVCVGIGCLYHFVEIYGVKKGFGMTVEDLQALPFFEIFKQIAENVTGSAYLDWVKDFVDSLPN